MKKQKGIGSVDDAFYMAEEYLEETGSKLGLKKKKNLLLKETHHLESQLHATHSPLQRIGRFETKFKVKSYLDTPIKKIRRKMKKF